MRGAALMLGIALVGAGQVGCTRGGSGYYGTTEPKHGPDEIWTNLGSEPEYIDPGKSSDHTGGTVILNMFAGLLQPHPATLEPMPELAESFSVSEDGMTYTFKLRPSVWSDGTPLTAADFVYSWRRVLDPKTASKYSSMLYPIRYGAMFGSRAVLVRGVGTIPESELRAFAERSGPLESMRMAPELDGAFLLVAGDDDTRGSARDRLVRALNGAKLKDQTLRAAVTDESVVAVRAPDPSTLVVDLEAPVPYFVNLLCFSVTLPVPGHVLSRLEREGKNTDLWTRPEHIVTNGAYTLVEWKFRQRMVLEKNPKYWAAAKVRTKRIRLSMVESYNTVLNLYEAGELDSIGASSAIPSEFIDTMKLTGDFTTGPQNSTYFYWVNTKAPPLDDARVRNALRLSIDRESLVKHVTRAGQVPTADLVPPGIAGYQGPGSPIYDPDRARKLLVEAGYGPERPLPKITLTYNTSEGHKQIAEAIQAQWKTALGIQVEIENQEWNVYLRNLKAVNFQLARMGWIGDYPDPFTFLELLMPQSGNNHSLWSDPKYNELLTRANLSRSKEERFALFKQAETIAMEAAPILPIYVYTRSELNKPYLRGNVINHETRHQFKYWWIDQRWYEGVQAKLLDHGFPARPLPAGAAGGGAH